MTLNPSLQSRVHEGAADILRFGTWPTHRARLLKIDPTFTLPVDPTLQEIADALLANEQRRNGSTMPDFPST